MISASNTIQQVKPLPLIPASIMSMCPSPSCLISLLFLLGSQWKMMGTLVLCHPRGILGYSFRLPASAWPIPTAAAI